MKTELQKITLRVETLERQNRTRVNGGCELQTSND